jgi:hypothetical protein
MKKYLVLILLAGVACILSACDLLNTPKEFRSEAGKFAITTTRRLTEATTPLDTPAGAVYMHLFTADQDKNSIAVGYSDYPEDVVNATDPNTMLDNACIGAVRNVNGTLISKDEITLEGNLGREIVANTATSTGEAVTVKARLYLVKSRLYMVMILAKRGDLTREVTDDFFVSFKLLP